jgi:hypothetical protein
LFLKNNLANFGTLLNNFYLIILYYQLTKFARR